MQCDRFAAAAVLAFNNQMAHLAHSCTPEYPAFLFVVLILALGQAVFHPVRPGVVHSFISVDRVSVVKIIDLQIGFSIRWLALTVKPQD